MDELIKVFFSENFSPEKNDIINEAFSLLELHMHPDPYSDIAEVIMMDLDADSKLQLTEKIVEQKIDHLLQQYTIATTDETDLQIKCKIIQAVVSMVDPEYPQAVLSKLEGFSTDLDKFCSLLKVFSDFEECDALLYIEDIRPEFLNTLKNHLYQKEQNEIIADPENNKIISNLNIFLQQHNRPLVGGEMLKAGVLVNMPFETYIPMIDIEDLGEDLEVSALNVLSVILLSKNGLEHAIQIFREQGSKIYPDPKVATEIERNLMKQLSDFNEYLKFQHEKARLPQTGQ